MSEPTGTPSPISEELSEQQLSELLQIRRDKLLAVSYTHLTLPTN